MAGEKRVLAFDFGASSGRAMIGIYDGKIYSVWRKFIVFLTIPL